MAWLIGIICVILMIVFWRIFLPLGVLAAAALVLFLLNDSFEQEKKQKEAQVAAETIREKIAVAKQNESPKEWKLFYEPDPASSLPVARTASIQSDDGLCFLRIEKRIEGTELTGLNCLGIKIHRYQDIDVKFDTDDASKKMRLDTYSDSDEVYIPSHQYEYSGQLKYRDFIGKFFTSKSLAIKIPSDENFWTRFSLRGAPESIANLGNADKSMANKGALKFDDLSTD